MATHKYFGLSYEGNACSLKQCSVSENKEKREAFSKERQKRRYQVLQGNIKQS